MFFLIGIWGHEKRVHAALKFALFTISGGLLMLVALIGLYLIHGQQTGVYTFAYARLLETHLSPTAQFWLYAAFLLAFAIKIPLIPVHTWLPDAHTHAPTAGSLDLAGLLLKAGFYGLFRFGFPLFPVAAQASVPILIALGLGGMFYAGWIALAQTDLKRLVAYSSIGHMGLMVVGLAVWNLMTLTGSLLQMINHGLSTTALFVMVGMLDERLHSRQFADMGGLWGKVPVFSAFFLFFAMASMGLPGLNNFVGEILILVGIFTARPVIGILSFAGLVLTVVYILRMVQDTHFRGTPAGASHPGYYRPGRLHPGDVGYSHPLYRVASRAGPAPVGAAGTAPSGPGQLSGHGGVRSGASRFKVVIIQENQIRTCIPKSPKSPFSKGDFLRDAVPFPPLEKGGRGDFSSPGVSRHCFRPV